MTRKEFARRLRKQFRRQHGYINPLPEDAVELLDGVEARFGFALPPIVRFVYQYAGEDFVSPEWSAEKYLEFRADPKWPQRMVPLAEEGCGIWLCVDCSQKQAPVMMYRGDYTTEESDDPVFEHEASSFAEWLRKDLPADDDHFV